MVRAIVILMTSFLISACTFAKWQAVNLPAHFFNGDIKNDITFYKEHNLSLMIAKPHDQNKAENKKLPVIVFYYGGRWSEGEKEKYRFAATTLADQGYLVVVPDYRQYPKVKYPAFQEDSAKALAWVYRNIDQYGGDPERLFVAGHSSGGHMGAMLAANKTFLNEEGLSPSIIKAFVGLAGPYDFEPEAKDVKDIFSDVQSNNYAAMKVSTFVEKDTPPMLLLYGLKDDIVYKRNVEKLMEAANKKGANVSYKYYDDMDHIEIMSALSWYFKDKKPVLNDMIDFFEKHNSD
jgi:acetyl esterase/lipase